MAEYIVAWTNTAIKQRRAILKYWTKRNKSTLYAEKIIYLTDLKLLEICSNPFSYLNADYEDTKVAIMGHFSIYFEIRNDYIYVKAFWDNRQNPKKLFLIFKQ
jgi:hypothetical protein